LGVVLRFCKTQELNVHAHFRFPWTRKTEINSIQLIENGQEENIFWQLQKIKQQKNKNKNKNKNKTKQHEII
jgi:hypothetical protein